MWKSDEKELGFGRLAFAHGLYQARMISDPLLQQDVETILDGANGNISHGPLTFWVGIASQVHPTDSVSTTRFPAIIPAVDCRWSEEGVARVSGQISHHRRDIDLAATIPVGPIALDIEGLLADGAWAPSEAAALAGVTCKPLDALDVPGRFDTRKPKGSGWERFATFGANWRFAELARAGVEWAQDLDGVGVLTFRLELQAGWESGRI